MWDPGFSIPLAVRSVLRSPDPGKPSWPVPLPPNKGIQGRKPGMIWVDNDVEREREDEEWLRRRREGLGLTAESPQTRVPIDDQADPLVSDA